MVEFREGEAPAEPRTRLVFDAARLGRSLALPHCALLTDLRNNHLAPHARDIAEQLRELETNASEP